MNIKDIIRLVSLACITIALSTSCIPEDEMNKNREPVFLELSCDKVDFTNQKVDMGYTPQITLKTNHSTVKAVSLAPSWLNVKYQDHGIYISVEENNEGTPRESSILIVAGSAKELVKVTQSSAKIVLDVSPKDCDLLSDGESLLVDVRSNAAEWSFEIEDGKTWLRGRRIDDFIQIIAEPNTTLKERTAQMYVTLVDRVIVVNFTQQPRRKNAKFALPLLVRRAMPYEVIAFEEKNGNYLLEYTAEAGLLGQPSSATIKFVYASPVYSDVVYNIDTYSKLVTDIVVTSYNPEMIQSKEFMDFLSYKGFSISNNTTDSSSSILTFSGLNSEDAYGVVIKVNKDKSKPSTITFKSRGKQSEPYTTFKEFPFDKCEYLLEGWTYAKIKENELSEGSILDYETHSEIHPSIIRESQYTVDPSNSPLVARIFGMNEEKIDPTTGEVADRLEQLVTVYDDLHLGAFFTEGKYFLTEEFESLLVASGFKYIKETNGLTQWYNDEKKLLIMPRGTRFSSVLDLMPVLAISYFHRDLSIQTKAEQEATLFKAYKDVLRQDKLLLTK